MSVIFTLDITSIAYSITDFCTTKIKTNLKTIRTLRFRRNSYFIVLILKTSLSITLHQNLMMTLARK